MKQARWDRLTFYCYFIFESNKSSRKKSQRIHFYYHTRRVNQVALQKLCVGILPPYLINASYIFLPYICYMLLACQRISIKSKRSHISGYSGAKSYQKEQRIYNAHKKNILCTIYLSSEKGLK